MTPEQIAALDNGELLAAYEKAVREAHREFLNGGDAYVPAVEVQTALSREVMRRLDAGELLARSVLS